MSFRPVTIIIAIFIATFLVNSSPILAQDSNIATQDTNVIKAPPALWIEPIDAPEIRQERLPYVTNGVVYQLADTQINWRPDGYEFYYHYTYKITDRAGLEQASKLSQEFDPADTELAFNFIELLREGKTEDRLTDATITTLRQEDGLATDIIDGNVTALVVLDDIRVGDTINYAVSGRVTSKLWPGHFFDGIQMGWTVPVGESRYRIIWPSDKPLYIKNFLTDIKPGVVEQNGQKIYSWLAADPDPIPGEEGTPAWVQSWPKVTVSSMDKWTDVQAWAKPYYDTDDQLPKEFDRKVKAIKKKWRKPKDRLTEALRLVQDNIRYVGIEIGPGSHVPRQPAEVVRRGYGDCKDKSVLLVAVLDKLGIKAWPALVDSNEGPGLPTLLPSPYAFNHAIVKVKIKDQIFWLDPTLSHQGGRGDTLVQPDYGYGLPIGSKNNGLEQIEIQTPERPTLHVQEAYLLPQSGDTAMELTVTATYNGSEADNQRKSNASQSLEELQRSYLDYYQGKYDGIKVVSPLAVTDDLDANKIVISGIFNIPSGNDETADVLKKMPLTAWAVRGLFYQPNQKVRRTNLLLPNALNRSHSIRIKMPGHRPAPSTSSEDTIETGAFNRTFRVEKDTMFIDFVLTNSGRSATPEQAAAAIDFAGTIQEKTNLTFNAEKVAQSYAGTFKVDEEQFAPLEERMKKILTAISEKKHTSALKILNELEQEYTQRDRIFGLIQTLRGETYMALNRRSAATAAFEQGLPLYDDQTSTYFKLAELYRSSENAEKEIKILTDLATRLPDEVGKLSIKWLGELTRNLYLADKSKLFNPLAIALVRAEYESDKEDGDGWVYYRAIDALVENNEPIEAASHLPKITNATSLLGLMIDKKYQAIWPMVEDRAGHDLRIALDREIDETKTAYEDDKTNFKKLNDYLRALRQGGSMEKAIAIAQPLIDDWSTIEAEAGDAFWTANIYAEVLNDVGHHEEAIAVLQRINELPIEDFPDSISMRINQASMLQSQAKFDEALALANSLNKDFTSDFGAMFIDGIRSCSLFHDDQVEAAQSIIKTMHEMKETNIYAYSAAMLCIADDDKLVDLFIERLEDEDDRAMTLERFLVGKKAQHTPPFERSSMTKLRRVLAIPKVRSVFEKFGRIIEIDASELHWGG